MNNKIYGYGFKVYVSDACLADFILNHDRTVENLDREDILAFIENCRDKNLPLDPLKEEFFDYESEITGDTGLYGIIADIMARETGINFEYRRAVVEDEDDIIIFPQMYPWQMNAEEHYLTKDKLERIVKGYINELGGQLIAEFVDITC